jgi:hypothetical protein
MNTSTLKKFLWNCILINAAVLGVMFIILMASDYVYKIHSLWFKGSSVQFKNMLYSLLSYYKLAFFFFNVVPYIALRMMKED